MMNFKKSVTINSIYILNHMVTNKSNKLLTIAIPSYNRERYLKECLDHVCCQLNNKVEVVVRDNKSTNYNFWNFIKPYEDKYGVVAYQNECNVGGDANFAKLFEKCSTKWFWILGDDDYLMPNILPKVIDLLENNPNDLFVNLQAPSFTGRIKGIKEFGAAMKGMNAFANAFFISVGIHNMDLGRMDNFYTYKYLSTKMSQIIRVMIHLRNDPNATCLFSDLQVLSVHGEDTCWKHDELIIPSLTVYDIFRPERNFFKDNVLRFHTGKLLHYISFSDLSFRDKMYYLHQVFVKFGYWNTVHYNFRHIIGVLLLKMKAISRK